MTARNDVEAAFDEYGRSILEKRRSSCWFAINPETVRVLHLQRSRWSPAYYLNVGILLTGLTDEPMSASDLSLPPSLGGYDIYLRWRPTQCAPATDIDRLLDLTVEIHDRKPQLLQAFEQCLTPLLVAGASRAGLRELHERGALRGAFVKPAVRFDTAS